MILTFEQIRSVTSGAVSLEQAEDGIHFYKCTKRQIEAWYKRGHSLGVRAETTTGVCLDFHTDATELCFSVAGGDGFEVMVNGLLRTRLKAGGPASFRVSLEDAESTELGKKARPEQIAALRSAFPAIPKEFLCPRSLSAQPLSARTNMTAAYL